MYGTEKILHHEAVILHLKILNSMYRKEKYMQVHQKEGGGWNGFKYIEFIYPTFQILGFMCCFKVSNHDIFNEKSTRVYNLVQICFIPRRINHDM